MPAIATGTENADAVAREDEGHDRQRREVGPNQHRDRARDAGMS